MVVNAKKCELILLSGHLDAFSIKRYINCKRVIGCNMDILGSPIGSNEHCELWISSKLDSKMDDLISKIIDTDHCHSSFELLLYCASFCKMVWYCQTFPPDLISCSCKRFDDSVIQCFENLIGCGLPQKTLVQARLGTKLTRLGLRSSLHHSAAAYLTSFFSNKALMELFLGTTFSNVHLEPAISSFNSYVHPESQVLSDSNLSEQNKLSSAIDKHTFQNLLSEVDVIDKARLLSCSRTHANAWIRALPSHQNKFSNQEWVITMKRWLGIPIFDKEHVCGACSEQVMDIFGLHASVCSVSGDCIKRHNAIRDSIFLFSSFAAWAPSKEKAFIFSGSSERPADILVPNFSLGKDLAVDFAITCPLQHKYLVDSSLISEFASLQ